MNKSIRSLLTLAAVLCVSAALGFAQDGAATYKAKCQMCHGPGGTPNPSLAKMMGIKNAADYKTVSAADMISAVKNGKGKMKPVTGLTDQQVKDVVAYFRTL